MNNESIILKTGREEYQKIFLSDIEYIKAVGNYTYFHFESDTEKLVICKSLKSLVNLYSLDEIFVKICRNKIVNKNKIVFFKSGKDAIVRLKSGVELKPSRNYFKNIKNKIQIIK